MSGTHQFALHAFMFFLAECVTNLALKQARATEMLEMTPRKSTASEDDRIDVTPRQPDDGEAFVDGFIRHPAAIDLAPCQALERDRRDHPIVVEQAGGGLVISGVDSENYHARYGLDGLGTTARGTYRPLPLCVNPPPGAGRGTGANVAVYCVPTAMLHHNIC